MFRTVLWEFKGMISRGKIFRVCDGNDSDIRLRIFMLTLRAVQEFFFATFKDAPE